MVSEYYDECSFWTYIETIEPPHLHLLTPEYKFTSQLVQSSCPGPQ